MMYSMTGYVTKSISFAVDATKTISIDMTLKSLNSKFFEANAKLPHVFYALENDILKILKKELRRGTVYLYVGFADSNSFKTSIEVSHEALGGYIRALEQIKSTYSIQDPIKISDIVRLPDIFVHREAKLTETQKKIFLDAIIALAQELTAQRAREGEALAADLTQRLATISDEIARIEKAFGQFFTEKEQEVHQKLSTMLVQDQEFAETQRKMLYMILDKMDINEEIVRFNSHIKKLHEVFSSADVEKGKAIDFTLQELGREVNTMLAKTAHATISHHALRIKVELEKMREQAQNIV